MKIKRLLIFLLVVACSAETSRTRIQDSVRRPDGAPFAGTVTITPRDFPASEAASEVSLTVAKGLLSTSLIPTAGLAGQPSYLVTYSTTDQKIQWSETWRVPSTREILCLKDVRVGSVAKNPPNSAITARAMQPMGSVNLPISISDVTGLSAALSQINNSLSTLTTSVTTLNTVVQNLVPVPIFVDLEIPSGTINGTNAIFSLSAAPVPPSSLTLIVNGLKLSPGFDYSVSGQTILFSPGAVPKSGDLLVAAYRLAGSPPASSISHSPVLQTSTVPR